MVARYKPKLKNGNGAAQGERRTDGKFLPGHVKRKGREKGVPNKVTRVFREAIELAAVTLGEDGKGKGELVGYMIMLAKKERRIFAQLVGRCIPLQVTGANNGPLQVLHLDPAKLKGLSPEELMLAEKLFGRMQKGSGPEVSTPADDAAMEDYEATLH